MVVIIGQRWAKDLKNKPNHSVTTIYAQNHTANACIHFVSMKFQARDFITF